MFDTLTVMAYLLSHHSGYVDRLKLQVIQPAQQQCVQDAVSPALRWQGVPPEAASLAVIVRDKQRYDWVAYNLPVTTTGLPFGASQHMSSHDQGMNSWGKKTYHLSCGQDSLNPVYVELYVLDKRFSVQGNMTGELLEQKMKGHVLEKVKVG